MTNETVETTANNAEAPPVPATPVPEDPNKIKGKMLSKFVTIHAFAKDTDTHVIPEFTSLRNLCSVKDAIINNSQLNSEDINKDETRLQILLKFEDTGEQPPMVDGLYKDVIIWLDSNIVTPATAMGMLQHLAIRFMETSSMKCGIITGLFEDNKVGGLGLFNEFLPMEDGNVNAFMSAASGQLDMYKKALRERGFNLMEDNKIILPGG